MSGAASGPYLIRYSLPIGRFVKEPGKATKRTLPGLPFASLPHAYGTPAARSTSQNLRCYNISWLGLSSVELVRGNHHRTVSRGKMIMADTLKPVDDAPICDPEYLAGDRPDLDVNLGCEPGPYHLQPCQRCHDSPGNGLLCVPTPPPDFPGPVTAHVVFQVNNGAWWERAGWAAMWGSLSQGAGWANPCYAGGGYTATAGTAAVAPSGGNPGSDGSGSQTVVQWLLPAQGKEYCNTVYGGSFRCLDGTGVNDAGSSNCTLVGTPNTTWNVTLNGSCMEVVNEGDPTVPGSPGNGGASVGWQVYGGPPTGNVMFNTIQYGPGHISAMPGAVGNSLTVRDGGPGTKFASTIQVTIPASGSIMVASIDISSMTNLGWCTVDVLTSINVTDISYVSGP